MRKQEPPFTIKLELTEGCNLRCSFCGLQGIREVGEKNYKFMSVDTISDIAQQAASLGWRSRWEFAMHGEPTMNPNVIECVAAVRAALPRVHLMMTSNGGGLLRRPGAAQNVQALFDAGLNVLALDDYKGANIVTKIRAALKEKPLNGVHCYECPADLRGNPYRRHPVSYKMVSFITDLQDTSAAGGNGIRSHMNNGCGAAFPPNENKAGRRCARPFRELAVRWDGNVALCCNDWRGFYKCGSALDGRLNATWQSAEINAARKKLYHGQRDFGPCAGCDSHSFRVGLLPDPAGRAALGRAGPRDREAIARALSGDPYTKPVLREWEFRTEQEIKTGGKDAGSQG